MVLAGEAQLHSCYRNHHQRELLPHLREADSQGGPDPELRREPPQHLLHQVLPEKAAESRTGLRVSFGYIRIIRDRHLKRRLLLLHVEVRSEDEREWSGCWHIPGSRNLRKDSGDDARTVILL